MQNAADAHLSAHGDDAEMFALAPVSLWLEDYSGLKQLFATWRHAGVPDLRAYLLDESVTELAFELESRPNLAFVPLQGLAALLAT